MKLDSEVLEIAKKIYKERSLLIMGRGYNFATCLEGALKIKVCVIEKNVPIRAEKLIYPTDFFALKGICRSSHICTVKE